MAIKHLVELILLASIWGASFLFMRVATPEFGTLNLAAMRIVIAAITLFPIFYLVAKKHLANIDNTQKKHLTKNLVLVGIGNSVIPFILFAYAATQLEAGLSSVANATTPLWGAAIGALFYATKMNRLGWLGLAIGFVGVLVLTSHKLSWQLSGEVLGILAVTTATLFYGISANYSKLHLAGVPPLLVASGTMLSSAVIVLPVLFFNDVDLSAVSATAWACLVTLGMLSTGIAYVLFYRLIEHTGATQAMMVTYLIPIFGVLFGKWFLNEPVFLNMLFGGLLILFGVMLTTGLIKQRPSAK